MEVSSSCASSRDYIYGVLQACLKRKDLVEGRNIYSLMIIHSLSTISALADHLIRLFSTSGSLSEAIHVFMQVSNPTVYTYNAIIAAHIEFSEVERALQLYQEMQQEGLHPDKVSYLHALKACSSMGAIEPGQLAHYQIMGSCLDADVLVGSTLIDMYAKCGFLKEAHRVFSALQHKNSVSWGVLIGGYVQNGYGLLGIELFVAMHQECVWPEKATFLSVLKACGSVDDVKQGMQVHELITCTGMETDSFIGNSLVDMYAKLDMMGEAHAVFESLTNKDVVSWVGLISGYSQHGHDQLAVALFQKMQVQGICPDRVSFLCVLKSSGNLGDLEQAHTIHVEVIMHGYNMDLDINNSTVHMYAKCGSLDEAHTVFELLKHRDIVTWSALIAGYMQHEGSLLAPELVERMQQEGFKPNTFIFSSALIACGNKHAIKQGRLLHDQIIANRLEMQKAVSNSLIDMYAKCGSVDESYNMFFKIQSPDEVSFGALIAGCAQQGQGDLALELFVRMQHEGLQLNEAIFSCGLKVCCLLGDANAGRIIHHQICESALEVDMNVGSSLVDMHAKCGSMKDADAVFKTLKVRDVVAWGAIIGGYAESENSLPAVQLYGKMEQDKVASNKVIFLSVLKACGSIAAATQGRQVHLEVTRRGLNSDLLVGSALIDCYAKCGSLQEAQKLLDELQTEDIVSWGSVIVGYACKGNWRMARQCLETMLSRGLKPDTAIYNNILVACSHGGVLDEGLSFFQSLCDRRVLAPDMVQCNLLFDLLARPGHLVEAVDILQTIPSPPEEVLWTSLLTGCTVYGNMRLARQQFGNPSLCKATDASHTLYQCGGDPMVVQNERLENYVRVAGAGKKPECASTQMIESIGEHVSRNAFLPGSDVVHATMSMDRLMREGSYPVHSKGGILRSEHITQYFQFSCQASQGLGRKICSNFESCSSNIHIAFTGSGKTFSVLRSRSSQEVLGKLTLCGLRQQCELLDRR